MASHRPSLPRYLRVVFGPFREIGHRRSDISSQTDPESEVSQVRPFSDDWHNEVKRLRYEVVAVRDRLSPFFLASPDPAEVALEGKVTEQVARYELTANNRHPTIRQAAVTVRGEVEKFARSRRNMGSNYISATPVITMKLEGVIVAGIEGMMAQFSNYLNDLTERFTDISKAAMNQEMKDLIRNTDPDPTQQKLIARYALVCGLAGKMIDAGNAFLNLNAELRAALEFYADGRAPHGWWEHLPAPVQSIFNEGTWAFIQTWVDVGVREALPAFIPYGGIPGAAVRSFLAIRGKRVEEQRAFRRGDVDELLDLADQLTEMNNDAESRRISVNDIVKAASVA